MAVNREQVLQSAEKLLSRGKLDQALKEYLRVLEENPRDISTLNKVGDLYVRMNRPGDSIPFFTRIADFYSKDGFFRTTVNGGRRSGRSRKKPAARRRRFVSLRRRRFDGRRV